MSWQHYLPAGFIARFSATPALRPRKSPLWVARRDRAVPFIQTAERVAAAKSAYNLKTYALDPQMVDKTWGYEGRLRDALDMLVQPEPLSVPAEVWLRTLVPFVVGIFVRSPYFTQAYEAQPEFAGWDKDQLRDNTNLSRLTAMQRLLAPVMAAGWDVLHLPTQFEGLTNDFGFTTFDNAGRESGWIIPLGSQQLLALDAMPEGYGAPMLREVARGDWRAVIGHVHLSISECAGLAEAIVDPADDFILAGTREAIDAQLDRLHGQRADKQGLFGRFPSPPMQRVHEFDWHRAVTAIQYASDDIRLARFEIDWNFLMTGWCSPSSFGILEPVYPTGLQLEDNNIKLYLSHVDGVTR